MDLKIDDLNAFLEAYHNGTFSKATKTLNITQSALSQKIARIEETLQSTIFIRHPRRLELTSSGEKLLIYAKQVISMQNDFLSEFDQYNHELSGNIRISGFSSVMRSIIIPTLLNIQKKNPRISIEFKSFEMYELVEKLKTNATDFIITDFYPKLNNTIEHEIGKEEYVIIESKKHKNIPNVFIDHHSQDNATESYYKFINKKIDYKRLYLGEVYSIIDAVASGVGRAVMSKHLVVNDKRFNIIENKKKYFRPIVLSYFKQNYYSPLQEKIINCLKNS